ncbi:retrovirus-related pol polyprotein from transposon TNT 1-94, partial [Tanacetum coccineum]
KVEESLNVTFDETPPPSKTSPLVDDDLNEEEAIKVTKMKILENNIEDETLEIDEIVNIKESRNHPLENIIGNLNQRTLRSQAQNQSNFYCFISTIEPKNVNEALGDERTKWVFRNKLDENGVVSQNKARLVAQGYNQQKGIDYDETYAPDARLESIRILLDYACALDFKLFQMDVKRAFLNGFINEEFEMSMMGELNFFLGLQIKQMEDGIFFNQSKYIKEMLKKFGLEDSKPMKTPMSSDTKLTKDEKCESVDSTKYQGMIGSLLYLTASRPDIMFSVCLCACFQEAPKTSHLEAIKRIFRYIKGTTHLGLWYLKGTDIETVVYADSDHAGDYVDRKITSGICTFVGCCLTSWILKKQTALAISTTKAEYVSAGKACQQAPWMKQALIDYNRLDELAYSIPLDGPYQTNLPRIEDIISSIRIDREGQVCRIRHEEEIDDHVPACLCFMLYYVVHSEKFNLAYYMAKRMEWVTKQARLILPYGMLLTRLFKFNIDEYPELSNDSYVLYDRVMNPLAAQLGQKVQRDRGTTSSSTFDQPSSSHLNDDDDDENNKGTSCASTPSPIRYVNSLTNQVPQVFQNPPNIDPNMKPFYTYQTEIINRQVQLRDEQRGGLKLCHCLSTVFLS